MTETCTFCFAHEPETERPVGPRCGRQAVLLVEWDDGRVSASCDQHGPESLDPDARARVVAVQLIAKGR